MLIGSSIVRDVREEKLVDTEVICKRGGYISEAKTAVKQLTPGYESLIIGGNDCEAKPPKPAEAIVKSYRELIDAAQEICQGLHSICPWLSSDEVQDSLNAGLVASCSEKDGVDFVHMTSSFRLADGSINDNYILPDGVHITRSAMNKMAAKLDFQIKAKKQGVCDTKHTKTDDHKCHQNGHKSKFCDYNTK